MTTYQIKNFAQRVADGDGRITIAASVNRPLPTEVYEDCVTITDDDGNVYLVEVLDFHDCYEVGGEQSYVWVEVV